MKTLVLRVDAHSQIGTGHVMRCLALAQACILNNIQSVFVMHNCPSSIHTRLSDEGFNVVNIQSKPGSLNDVQETIQSTKEINAEWIVIDGYQFNTAYQSELVNTGYKILWIDDYGHCDNYIAHLILNQNFGAKHNLYPNHGEDTQFLLGSQYALLRQEFLQWKLQRKIPEKAKNILVTMGGSDPDNITLTVLKALENVPNIHIKVIIGPCYPHKSSLHTIVELQPNRIELLDHVIDMPHLMAWADFAISAGGSTCWELAFMNVPCCIIVLSDNQKIVAQAFDETKAGVLLGFGNHLTQKFICEQVTTYLDSITTRTMMIERSKYLVDGLGTHRVCQMLQCPVHFTSEELHIRQAKINDVIGIWNIANEPSVRENSFHQDYISFDHHIHWFQSRLTNPDSMIWLADWKNHIAGIVRYDRVNSQTVEVSFAVSSLFRGKGVGKQLLHHTQKEALDYFQANRITGTVFQHNNPSIQLFQKTGYQKYKEYIRSGISCYEYEYVIKH